MVYADRTAHLKAEGAYAVLAKAQLLEAAGREIIHLEIGQPDFDTFDNISQAGMRAIAGGKTNYTPPEGTRAFRLAIAADASARRGVDIRAEQVVVSPGGKPNIFFPTLALVNPGDEVIYPNPGFPTYEAMIEVAGGIPVPVPLVEENDFSFDLDALDRRMNKKTKMIIINSPSNPTGGIIPESDLEQIAEAARKYDAWVLSDEIYSRIVYDGLCDAPSIYALSDMAERTIIMDGFSKTYAMTGWRLGYGIMPEELAQRVGLLMTHAVGSTAEFTQYAGLEALTGDQGQVDAVVAEYEKRRNAIVDGLNSLPGISCQKPQGAFYVFPNVSGLGKSSDEVANWILEDAGVALLSGTSFGKMGEGYLRLSYANSIENIELAIGKMAEVLG
ncbi:MAG: pyridoxal phosphate-dependent aminotransferase [Deltaproteobacteria bacterium]|nr:MAG: pyridoxal phosphate-dependent aminotransferase [Deltaproteobacteria bacterium]